MMGLLDDLLGGLSGQGPTARQRQDAAATGASGTGMSQVLMTLMPLVLGMLANRETRSGPNPSGYAQSGGGGLGGVLGQVLGGGMGSSGAGGLGSLLEQLQRAGYGEHADSWVGGGANKPIPPDAMSQVFGREGLQQISRQAGISEDEASRGLSQLLPEVVDRMTPNGKVPDADSLSNSVEDLARRLGIR